MICIFALINNCMKDPWCKYFVNPLESLNTLSSNSKRMVSFIFIKAICKKSRFSHVYWGRNSKSAAHIFDAYIWKDHSEYIYDFTPLKGAIKCFFPLMHISNTSY